MSRRPTPARVNHMLSTTLLAELLAPSYAKANDRTADDVYDEVKAGIAARLHGPLCDAIWKALQKTQPGRDDATLLDHLAGALASKIGARIPSATKSTLEKMNAVFACIDLEVGRASDATRSALSTPQGERMLHKAIDVAADFIVSRW
jgi:hypothetical protein